MKHESSFEAGFLGVVCVGVFSYENMAFCD